MKEIASAVSAASTTRSVMYVKTLNARILASATSHCARSYSTAVSRGERFGNALHFHEPRALHEQRRARCRFAFRRLDERVDRVEVRAALAECFDRAAARLAGREQHV